VLLAFLGEEIEVVQLGDRPGVQFRVHVRLFQFGCVQLGARPVLCHFQEKQEVGIFRT
jgi:aminoglycoside N3'-acetyltransferase